MTIARISTVLSILANLPFVAASIGAVVPPNSGNQNGGYGWNQHNEPLTGLFKFVGAGEAVAGGHRHAYANLAPLTGSRASRLYVPNTDQNSNDPKPELLDAVKDLKPGDVVKVEYQQTNGIPVINSLKLVDVKPGEDTPNGYIFEGYDSSENGPGMVTLSKYGQDLKLAASPVRGEKGKMQTDPKLDSALGQLKAGDVVYAQVNPGRVPVLTAIFPYKDPETGKLTKMTTQEVEGNPKAPAVEIETADGKTITAVIQGRLNNKRWVPDTSVLRDARRLHAGTAIEYLTQNDGDKTVLIQIAKAPPAPKEAKSEAPTRMKKSDKSEKSDK